MKQFYSHIIEIESLIVELDKLDLEDEQKRHLASLIDSSLHHTIMEAVLSQLQDDDKKLFIKYLEEDDHDKIWKFLNERVEDIENKIKKASEDLKYQLYEDLKKARQRRGSPQATKSKK